MRKTSSIREKKSPPGVHVWLVLIKAFKAISVASAASLQESGLCDSDFRVLEALLHKGGLPVNVIGPLVQLTPGSISTAVDRLHARGLVSREETVEDRRVRMVNLTPRGRALIVPVFRRHAAGMEKVASVLSPQERRQLEALLKKIGRHAENFSRAESSLVSGAIPN